jgi:hypothetical protein
MGLGESPSFIRVEASVPDAAVETLSLDLLVIIRKDSASSFALILICPDRSLMPFDNLLTHPRCEPSTGRVLKGIKRHQS